jgi:hypothetical protein
VESAKGLKVDATLVRLRQLVPEYDANLPPPGRGTSPGEVDPAN